jgi:uncharacterized membrane protein required for colicin V production
MIPIEFFWFALWLMFCVIGAARGLNKELGTSAILLLSLFTLKFGWQQLGERMKPLLEKVPISSTSAHTAEAIYYIVGILFVTFIAYEGVVLQFPVKQQKGVVKGIFGFLGGWFNGYLVVGTVWDVINKAEYFGIKVPSCCETKVAITSCLTDFHNLIVQYLPVTLIPAGVFLVLGMILLLAIILK